MKARTAAARAGASAGALLVAIGSCTDAAPVGAVVIALENGRELTAREFWYADGEIRFTWRGGVVGVPPEVVRAIRADAPSKLRGAAGSVNANTSCATAGACRRTGHRLASSSAMASKDELYDRAVDFVADGNLDEAITTYEQALVIDPGFTDAMHGIAMAYADKGDFERAIEWGKKLVELTPDDTLAHTSLSMFYQRAGMIPEAEAEGAKARVLDWKRQLAEQNK
jgi:tetratricopeptide (TPR) repeat protein